MLRRTKVVPHFGGDDLNTGHNPLLAAVLVTLRCTPGRLHILRRSPIKVAALHAKIVCEIYLSFTEYSTLDSIFHFVATTLQ